MSVFDFAIEDAKISSLEELDDSHWFWFDIAEKSYRASIRGTARGAYLSLTSIDHYIIHRKQMVMSLIYWREIVRRAGGLG